MVGVPPPSGTFVTGAVYSVRKVDAGRVDGNASGIVQPFEASVVGVPPPSGTFITVPANVVQ